MTKPAVDLDRDPLTLGTVPSACRIFRHRRRRLRPGLRCRARRPSGRHRRHRRQSGDTDDRQHLVAMELSGDPLDRVSAIFWCKAGANTNDADPGDGARGRAEDVAALFGDVDEREAFRAHRRSLSATAPRSALTPRRCGVVEKSWKGFVSRARSSMPTARSGSPPSTRSSPRSARVRPERARRREGMGHVPRRGRSRRIAGFPEERHGGRRRERGREGNYAVTLSRSIYEPFTTFSERRDLREKALQGLHRPWRERRGDRQCAGGGKDARAARREGEAARLRELRRAEARRHHGEDAEGGVTTCSIPSGRRRARRPPPTRSDCSAWPPPPAATRSSPAGTGASIRRSCAPRNTPSTKPN